jgi:putative SOS response-associated peptidase YedK
MPVIVAPDDYETWLTGEPDDVQGLVRPYPTDEMQVWPVSKRVSRSLEEGADLALPADGEHAG